MDIRENYLVQSFHLIELSHKQSYLFGQIFDNLGIMESAPCAANFRDALFHFKRLYESDFNEEYVAQFESIVEHSNRVYKDSVVRLIQVLIFSLNKLMQNADIQEEYMCLYDFKTSLKNIQLELRLRSLEIKRPLDDQDFLVAANKKITEVLRTLKGKGLLLELKKCNGTFPDSIEQ